jgi:hypothetical protein
MAEGLLGLKNGLLDALVLEPVDNVGTAPMNNLGHRFVSLSHKRSYRQAHDAGASAAPPVADREGDYLPIRFL